LWSEIGFQQNCKTLPEKQLNQGQVWWLVPVIPATQEVGIQKNPKEESKIQKILV
jgi:hypothetical protein